MLVSETQTVFTKKMSRYGHELERTIRFGTPESNKQYGKPRCCQAMRGNFGSLKQCPNVGKSTDEAGYSWCGHHTKESFEKKAAAKKERNRKWHADFDAKWNRSKRIQAANTALLQAMREIAAGHNDARSLATDVMKEYDEAHAMPMEGDTST
jgi:hypothetical protein